MAMERAACLSAQSASGARVTRVFMKIFGPVHGFGKGCPVQEKR
jgi:hypothetical protein